jgi:WD40 repeat protein
VIGSESGELRVIAEDTVSVLATHAAPVTCVAIDPAEKVVASCGADGSVWLSELATGGRIAEHRLAAAMQRAVFSPDGRHLLVYSGEQPELQVFSVDRGSSVTLRGRSITTAAFDPSGTRVAASEWDGSMRVWSIEGTELATYAHSGPLVSLGWSPDGQVLAAGGLDGSLLRWDPVTGGAERIAGHSDQIPSLAFSPDGDLIATTSLDRTVRVWDRRSLVLLASIPMGIDFADHVQFDTDARILTADTHGVDLWNAARFSADHRAFAAAVACRLPVELSTEGRLVPTTARCTGQ